MALKNPKGCFRWLVQMKSGEGLLILADECVYPGDGALLFRTMRVEVVMTEVCNAAQASMVSPPPHRIDLQKALLGAYGMDDAPIKSVPTNLFYIAAGQWLTCAQIDENGVPLATLEVPDEHDT